MMSQLLQQTEYQSDPSEISETFINRSERFHFSIREMFLGPVVEAHTPHISVEGTKQFEIIQTATYF